MSSKNKSHTEHEKTMQIYTNLPAIVQRAKNAPIRLPRHEPIVSICICGSLFLPLSVHLSILLRAYLCKITDLYLSIWWTIVTRSVPDDWKTCFLRCCHRVFSHLFLCILSFQFKDIAESFDTVQTSRLPFLSFILDHFSIFYVCHPRYDIVVECYVINRSSACSHLFFHCCVSISK